MWQLRGGATRGRPTPRQSFCTLITRPIRCTMMYHDVPFYTFNNSSPLCKTTDYITHAPNFSEIENPRRNYCGFKMSKSGAVCHIFDLTRSAFLPLGGLRGPVEFQPTNFQQNRKMLRWIIDDSTYMCVTGCFSRGERRSQLVAIYSQSCVDRAVGVPNLEKT